MSTLTERMLTSNCPEEQLIRATLRNYKYKQTIPAATELQSAIIFFSPINTFDIVAGGGACMRFFAFDRLPSIPSNCFPSDLKIAFNDTTTTSDCSPTNKSVSLQFGYRTRPDRSYTISKPVSILYICSSDYIPPLMTGLNISSPRVVTDFSGSIFTNLLVDSTDGVLYYNRQNGDSYQLLKFKINIEGPDRFFRNTSPLEANPFLNQVPINEPSIILASGNQRRPWFSPFKMLGMQYSVQQGHWRDEDTITAINSSELNYGVSPVIKQATMDSAVRELTGVDAAAILRDYTTRALEGISTPFGLQYYITDITTECNTNGVKTLRFAMAKIGRTLNVRFSPNGQYLIQQTATNEKLI